MTRSHYGRRRARAGGFTLIELTLAAGIAALVSLTLYTALNTAMRVRKSADSQIGAARRASIALDLLETDLQSLVPAKGTYAGTFIGTASGSGSAESDSLQFDCIGRDRQDDPTATDPLAEGVRQVQIGIQSDGLPSPSIVRRTTRNLLSQTQADYEDEVLVDGVRAFSIRYYDGSEWLQQWDSSSQSLGDTDAAVPMAIEISIELDERGPRTPNTPGQPQGYRASRIIPIAIATPNAQPTDSSTSTSTGGGT